MFKANSTKGRTAQHKVITDHYLAKFPLTNYMRIIKSPLVVSQVQGTCDHHGQSWSSSSGPGH